MEPTDPETLCTYAARVSPPGAGGIGLIQILGPQALSVVMSCLRPRREGRNLTLEPDRPRLVRFMDGDELVDEVVVVCSEPSTEGSSVLISGHGGVRVVERILMSLERSGAVIREHLEAREVWNLSSPIEAAVMDSLPLAQTQRMAKWLIGQIAILFEAMKNCQVSISHDRTDDARSILEKLLQSHPRSRMLLDGIHVVIVGPPNSGKSTLANCLYEKPWSIESAEAGTTRDWVEHPIAIRGVPVSLADTAGLRQGCDALEQQALELSAPVIRRADVQLLVLDGSLATCPLSGHWFDSWLDERRVIVVLNKSDLGIRLETPEWMSQACWNSAVRISALQNHGVDAMGERMLQQVGLDSDFFNAPCIWDRSQYEAIEEILKFLNSHPQQAITEINRHFLAFPT